MIENHYDKTASTERLSVVIGDKKAYTSHLPAVPCFVYPEDDEVTQDMTGAFGKGFIMLSPIVDIAEGDRVFINSEEYRVMGTIVYNFGRNAHRKTRLRIFKSS